MVKGLLGNVQFQRTKFLLWWIIANSLGGYFVGFLGGNEHFVYVFLTGAIIGSLQWWVLKRQGRRFRLWPVASAVGWIIGVYVRAFSQAVYAPVVEILWNQFGLWEIFWLNFVAEPISTLGMAIAQGFVIGFKGCFIGMWLLASLIGGAAQGILRAAGCAAICHSLPSGLAHGLGWASYGLFTGIAWLVSSRDG